MSWKIKTFLTELFIINSLQTNSVVSIFFCLSLNQKIHSSTHSQSGNSSYLYITRTHSSTTIHCSLSIVCCTLSSVHYALSLLYITHYLYCTLHIISIVHDTLSLSCLFIWASFSISNSIYNGHTRFSQPQSKCLLLLKFIT
jgi:hypothetical protein